MRFAELRGPSRHVAHVIPARRAPLRSDAETDQNRVTRQRQMGLEEPEMERLAVGPFETMLPA